ncbi:MAG: hypothetical protein ACRDNT_00735 [Streptosporangiaceae bacterium]
MIGIFGYRWIHRVIQVTVVVVGLSMIIMLIQGLRYGSLPAKETTMAAPTAGLFLAGAALLVIDMLSWAPFVSDYTRYLPVNTSGRRLFWAIYAGWPLCFPRRRQRAGISCADQGSPVPQGHRDW